MDSLIKPIISNKAAFGRHETFSLRYGWLPKGFQEFQKDNKIFNSDAATVKLGVGKNMVNAIRYWLRTTQMLEMTPEGLQTTQLGEALLGDDGWDPYLEDEATLWLIHWLIATNAELSTAWYWFFNGYHKVEFNVDEAANVLVEFVNRHLTGKHSEKTVRHEINVILKMYCQPKSTAKTEWEDILDIPLAPLGLVSTGMTAQTFISRPERRENLPLGIFAFAVNEVFNLRKTASLPIVDLMYGEKTGVGVGSVFRMTEAGLMTKLEQLVALYPTRFNINETAGINQLFREEHQGSSLDFLHNHYVFRDQAA